MIDDDKFEKLVKVLHENTTEDILKSLRKICSNNFSENDSDLTRMLKQFNFTITKEKVNNIGITKDTCILNSLINSYSDEITDGLDELDIFQELYTLAKDNLENIFYIAKKLKEYCKLDLKLQFLTKDKDYLDILNKSNYRYKTVINNIANVNKSSKCMAISNKSVEKEHCVSITKWNSDNIEIFDSIPNELSKIIPVEDNKVYFKDIESSDCCIFISI